MLMKAEDWEPRVLGTHAESRITYFGHHEIWTIQRLLSMVLSKGNRHLSGNFGISYFVTWYLAWRASDKAKGTLVIQQTASGYYNNTIIKKQIQELG